MSWRRLFTLSIHRCAPIDDDEISTNLMMLYHRWNVGSVGFFTRVISEGCWYESVRKVWKRVFLHRNLNSFLLLIMFGWFRIASKNNQDGHRTWSRGKSWCHMSCRMMFASFVDIYIYIYIYSGMQKFLPPKLVVPRYRRTVRKVCKYISR